MMQYFFLFPMMTILSLLTNSDEDSSKYLFLRVIYTFKQVNILRY